MTNNSPSQSRCTTDVRLKMARVLGSARVWCGGVSLRTVLRYLLLLLLLLRRLQIAASVLDRWGRHRVGRVELLERPRVRGCVLRALKEKGLWMTPTSPRELGCRAVGS